MKGNMALMKRNMALTKDNMALTKGNIALCHVRNNYMKHCLSAKIALFILLLLLFGN